MKQLLDEFLRQSVVISEKVRSIPAEVFAFRPFEEAWTIQEHLIHLVDNETNSFIRFKTALAEPGKTIFVIDDDKWVEVLDAHRMPVFDYLSLFALLRKLEYDFLIHVPEDGWETSYFTHPSSGAVTLKTWLERIAKHVNSHIEYIDRNLKLWNEAKD